MIAAGLDPASVLSSVTENAARSLGRDDLGISPRARSRISCTGMPGGIRLGCGSADVRCRWPLAEENPRRATAGFTGFRPRFTGPRPWSPAPGGCRRCDPVGMPRSRSAPARGVAIVHPSSSTHERRRAGAPAAAPDHDPGERTVAVVDLRGLDGLDAAGRRALSGAHTIAPVWGRATARRLATRLARTGPVCRVQASGPDAAVPPARPTRSSRSSCPSSTRSATSIRPSPPCARSRSATSSSSSSTTHRATIPSRWPGAASRGSRPRASCRCTATPATRSRRGRGGAGIRSLRDGDQRRRRPRAGCPGTSDPARAHGGRCGLRLRRPPRDRRGRGVLGRVRPATLPRDGRADLRRGWVREARPRQLAAGLVPAGSARSCDAMRSGPGRGSPTRTPTTGSPGGACGVSACGSWAPRPWRDIASTPTGSPRVPRAPQVLQSRAYGPAHPSAGASRRGGILCRRLAVHAFGLVVGPRVRRRIEARSGAR